MNFMKKVIVLIYLVFVLASCWENKVVENEKVVDSNIEIKVEEEAIEEKKVEIKEQLEVTEIEKSIEEKELLNNLIKKETKWNYTVSLQKIIDAETEKYKIFLSDEKVSNYLITEESYSIDKNWNSNAEISFEFINDNFIKIIYSSIWWRSLVLYDIKSKQKIIFWTDIYFSENYKYALSYYFMWIPPVWLSLNIFNLDNWQKIEKTLVEKDKTVSNIKFENDILSYDIIWDDWLKIKFSLDELLSENNNDILVGNGNLIKYNDIKTNFSFLYPQTWTIITKNREITWKDTNIITLNTDNFKIGKSLGSWERDTNIEIELYFYESEEMLKIPYWMFFWEEKTKILIDENWNKLFVKIYIDYLSDNPMTDKTPWVKEYRKEIKFYNEKYFSSIEKVIESLNFNSNKKDTDNNSVQMKVINWKLKTISSVKIEK